MAKGWMNVRADDHDRHVMAGMGMPSGRKSKISGHIATNQERKRNPYLSKDSVVYGNAKAPTYEPNVPSGGKLFKLKNGVVVVAWYEKTRMAFRHLAVAYQWDGSNWVEVYRTKIPYQNRTWEAYEYQRVLEKAINGINSNEIVLNAEEKKKAMELAQGKFVNEEHERVNKEFGSIGAMASLGEVFGSTPKEKNDFKARILKAGLESKGLQIPEDWETLSESEKEKRLDNVIKFLKEKEVIHMVDKKTWDWMDKVEGKKVGSSYSSLIKEKKRQGYSVVQDGTLIGTVKNKKNASQLPMYDYWAKKTSIRKNKGWTNESERHRLARYGIKTKLDSLSYGKSKKFKKGLALGALGTTNDAQKRNAIVEWGRKQKKLPEKYDIVVSELDNVEQQIKHGNPSVANDMINDVKRNINAQGKLDWMNKSDREYAFSILSDAQETLSMGDKEMAVKFVKQAQDLYNGNYKKKGDEITFKNGEVAIF